MQNERYLEEHSLLGSGATYSTRSSPMFLINLPLSSSGSKDPLSNNEQEASSKLSESEHEDDIVTCISIAR
jgi:hypothetical protein